MPERLQRSPSPSVRLRSDQASSPPAAVTTPTRRPAAADTFTPASAGTVGGTVSNLEDPRVMKQNLTDITWKPVQDGKLFVDGVGIDDVMQGEAGTCYLMAAMASVAHARPEFFQDAITDNGDNTYTVRFFEVGSRAPVRITVDGDLPILHRKPLPAYAMSRAGNELWVGLVEKAYAQWKGGYDAIGNGGFADKAFAELTGRSTRHLSTRYASENEVFAAIAEGASQRRPMVAPTPPPGSGASVEGTGLVPYHYYSVVGAEESGGERYVLLRNPFGQVEPSGNGANDGSFRLALSDFMRFFRALETLERL